MQETNNSTNTEYLEREKQVIELSKQNKSTRYIAEALKMSLRDIGLIRKKYGINQGFVTIKDSNQSPNEKATQAYKLFNEGKKPVEVAIQLGLSEKEATRYYAEFWKLKRLYKLYQIYTELEHCLPSFLKLHSALKKKGLNPNNVEGFADAIETGVIKLPEIHNQYESAKKLLQNKYQDLQNKVQTVHHQKQKLERDSHVINNRIIELTESEALYSSNCKTLQNEIEHLYNEKCQLEQFVSRFRNTNKKYLKIKSIAKEEVNRLLAEQEPPLDLALMVLNCRECQCYLFCYI